jgi:hypothetical protein
MLYQPICCLIPSIDLSDPNHLNLSREIHEHVSEADFTGTILTILAILTI